MVEEQTWHFRFLLGKNSWRKQNYLGSWSLDTPWWGANWRLGEHWWSVFEFYFNAIVVQLALVNCILFGGGSWWGRFVDDRLLLVRRTWRNVRCWEHTLADVIAILCSVLLCFWDLEFGLMSWIAFRTSCLIWSRWQRRSRHDIHLGTGSQITKSFQGSYPCR